VLQSDSAAIPVVGPEPEPDRADARGVLERLVPLVAALLLAGAVWILHRELAHYRYREIREAIAAVPLDAVAAAVALTCASFVALMTYDFLALRYAGCALPLRKTAFTSFVAFAFSQMLGFSLLTGGAVRYRLYSTWGLSPTAITRVVAFSTATFWLGVLSVGGLALLTGPAVRAPVVLPGNVSTGLFGALLALGAATYVALTVLKKGAIRVGRWDFPLPRPGLAAAQLVAGTADWCLAASVLYVLLVPVAHVPFPTFVAIYVVANVIGLVSYVPGGLGVFESLVVLMLKPYAPAAPVIAALLAYRAVYYLLPFSMAVLALGAYELRHRQAIVTAVGRTVGEWTAVLAPRVLAGATFVAGAILLVSGATPGVGSRLRWLSHALPLPLIEFSHFSGSLLGLGLLFLAWGLQRRLDVAYHLTLAFLGAGIVASLLKGLDYEEAFILGVMLAALAPARRHFYRKASFTSEPFSIGWTAAVVVVLAVAILLGLFSYKHVAYRGDIWWRFTLHGDAPRFLRASVSVLVAAGAFAVYRLLRPAPPEPPATGAAELARAEAVIARSSSAQANLVFLGDKSLLFSQDGAAFIQYAMARRTWVALGDPVGPEERHAELTWEFRELVDRHGGHPVFYQVAGSTLPLYLDLGLIPLKLGEEARVPLGEFSLEGGTRKGLRRVQHAVEKDGCTFALIGAADVPGVLPELRVVSDAWLGLKRTREKGFSLGRFVPEYLLRFPVAVVRRQGMTIAFANVLPSGDRAEITVDLMRYRNDAPDGVMEYLLIEMMRWGKAEGYREFNLGMAPLSGLENRALAPLWNRVSALAFRHGEQFYNFQGLRKFKEKFHPAWSPRYLASPGGFALPRILADVAALISGGLRGVVTK
jgi:phosphatidylglycerol lysyltransferase